jgi:hypothetical protein
MTRLRQKFIVGACLFVAVAGPAAACGGNGSSGAATRPPDTPTTDNAAPTPSETPPSTDTLTGSPTIASPTPSSSSPTESPTSESSLTPPAGSTYLADLSPVEGSASPGSIDINGRTYVHSIYQSSAAYSGNKQETQYDLGRKCDELSYTAGVTDDSASVSSIQFEVYGDGRLLKTARLGYGEDAQQTVNVQDVLRLKLQNIGLRLPSGSMYAGWGDATIRCRTD